MNDSTFFSTDAVTMRIVRFLIEIGLAVRSESIREETFLPGILIRGGVLLVDEPKLKYPGDLLHEAGHLASVTQEKRKRMGTYTGIEAHEEMAAIAWSWAALKHLGLEPDLVFHAGGYRGESPALIEGFRYNNGPGISCLAWFGMCSDPNAGPDDVNALPPFPQMTHWLRPPVEPA